MHDRGPTIRGRELGAGLRSAAERAGLNGVRLAEWLGWSEPKVSRVFSGKRTVPPVEAAAFLAACRVTGAELDRLLELSRRVEVRNWCQEFGPRLPAQVATLVDHQTSADAVTEFQNLTVPSMLQTRDYTLALFEHSATVPADEIAQRLAARRARRAVLSERYGPMWTFLVHEQVLRLPVGGDEVMSGQLHHLLRMSVRDNITIRVVPTDRGAHAGAGGPFQLLQSSGYRSVVYLEAETSVLFLETAEEVAAYQRIFARLIAAALDATRSRELISAIVVSEHGGTGDHGDELVAAAGEL